MLSICRVTTYSTQPSFCENDSSIHGLVVDVGTSFRLPNIGPMIGWQCIDD